MKRIIAIMLLLILVMFVTFGACSCASKQAEPRVLQPSYSLDARRKLTVINLRTDKILFEAEGHIAIKRLADNKLDITIQAGENQYVMYYVYTDSEVAYIVGEVQNLTSDPYYYVVRAAGTYRSVA